jgi:CRP-like cAMP-binding protein
MPDFANATGNRLLDALPPEDLGRLLPHLKSVPLPLNTPLQSSNVPIEFVHFVTHGFVSFVAQMEDGATVEIGAIGNEGMVGVSFVLGVATSPHQAFVQAAGAAWRMEASRLADEVDRSRVLRAVLLRYAQSLHVYAAQTAACNARHTVHERFARWLLIAHDRIGADEMPLTQEFLAMMLGVRRPGVTLVASTLQKAGMIRYRHGHISVLDRAALETAACECYRIVKDEADRLLG